MHLTPFGMELIKTGDLDPVYFVTQLLEEHEKFHWCLAYWCFYDCGTAFRVIREPQTYFDSLRTADTGKWKRGTERRHFRADNSRRSIDSLEAVGGYDLQGKLSTCRTFSDVQAVTNKLSGFGPWATFKVADMMERCLGVPVAFSSSDIQLYRSPAEAAQLYRPGVPLTQVLDDLVEEFKGVKAPPHRDRDINVQEVETILCKWGSHVSGRYQVGHDIHEVRESLDRVDVSLTQRWSTILERYQHDCV